MYDANVLYPSFLRDVLLRLAVADLVAARWSATIQDEWRRHLLVDRPDITPEQVARTQANMDRTFPRALVVGYEPLVGRLELPDPDDRHVLAAAIHAGASVIVTRNLSDFPAAVLTPLGLEALSPDQFVGRLLDADFDTTVATLERHRTGLTRPSLSVAEYQAAFVRNDMPTAAERLPEPRRYEGLSI